MAIKTITLRPTSNYVGPNGNPSEASGMIRIPESTINSEVYRLVNESVADNAATTISPALLLAFYPGFSIPEEYITIEPVSIRVCMKAYASTGSGNLTVYSKPISLDGTVNGDLVQVGITSTTYELYTIEIPQDSIPITWGGLTGIDTSYLPYLTVVGGGGGKNSTYAITQLYLEVDFDIEEPSGVYVKRNGTMTEVQQMYHKVNGHWTEITADECKNLIKSYYQGGL